VRWCECESCPQATRGRARAPPAWRRALHRIPSHPPASIPSHSSSAPSHPLPSRSEARTARSAARTAGRAWLTRRRKKGLQGAQIDLQSGESNSRARESSFGRANRVQADGRRWRSSRSRGGAGRGGSDGGAQGSGRPNLRPCATQGSSTSGPSRGVVDPTGGAQQAAEHKGRRRLSCRGCAGSAWLRPWAASRLRSVARVGNDQPPYGGSLLHPWEEGPGEASRGVNSVRGWDWGSVGVRFFCPQPILFE
jgi:hypothetical protein